MLRNGTGTAMIYAFADYEIDTRLYELRSDRGPRPIEPRVFDMLVYLVENRTRVIPKAELLDTIWRDRSVSEAALSQCIMAARKALGDSGRAQTFIKTIHRRGYRFIAQVNEAVPETRRTRPPPPLRPD
jgi:DNA-binding winged helix-turn-helix (wHTH) protein